MLINDECSSWYNRVGDFWMLVGNMRRVWQWTSRRGQSIQPHSRVWGQRHWVLWQLSVMISTVLKYSQKIWVIVQGWRCRKQMWRTWKRKDNPKRAHGRSGFTGYQPRDSFPRERSPKGPDPLALLCRLIACETWPFTHHWALFPFSVSFPSVHNIAIHGQLIRLLRLYLGTVHIIEYPYNNEEH